MMFNDTKSLVGENCLEYDSKYVLAKGSMTHLAQSCLSCTNYTNGQCSKDLFNQAYESLSVN
jgi:hypothetical protein